MCQNFLHDKVPACSYGPRVWVSKPYYYNYIYNYIHTVTVLRTGPASCVENRVEWYIATPTANGYEQGSVHFFQQHMSHNIYSMMTPLFPTLQCHAVTVCFYLQQCSKSCGHNRNLLEKIDLHPRNCSLDESSTT